MTMFFSIFSATARCSSKLCECTLHINR